MCISFIFQYLTVFWFEAKNHHPTTHQAVCRPCRSWLLEIEDRPFSLNTHYLSDYKSKFLAHYKGSREKYERSNLSNIIDQYVHPTPSVTNAFSFGKGNSNQPQPPPTGITKVLAGLAEIGMSGIKAEDLPKLLPPDRMEPALTIMADVRAYFQGLFPSFLSPSRDLKPWLTICLVTSGLQTLRWQRTTRYWSWACARSWAGLTSGVVR